MKKTISFVSLLICTLAAIAQSNFEGILVYRNSVVSKMEGVSNITWRKILHFSDQSTVLVKDGNFRQSSDRTEAWVFPSKGRTYYKFKGYDSLYYSETGTDTSSLVSVTKNNNKKMIAGYNCNSITIATTGGTYNYFYSPTIYMNPALTQNYKADREDVFYTETSSLYLGVQHETPFYTYSENCIQVQQKAIDGSSFDLPGLPQQKITPTSFLKYPEFNGKQGWGVFLNKSIDPTVAGKYLKIKHGEDGASQTVIVNFMVSESGSVYDVNVANKKDVNSKLAEEAIRVINISHWHPATVFGDPIPYKMTQPITFQVSKG